MMGCVRILQSLCFHQWHKHRICPCPLRPRTGITTCPKFLPTNPTEFQLQILKYLFRNMRDILSWWHIFIQISQLVLLSNYLIWTLLTTSCSWDYHWSLHWSQFIICYSYAMILGWYKQETKNARDKYEKYVQNFRIETNREETA